MVETLAALRVEMAAEKVVLKAAEKAERLVLLRVYLKVGEMVAEMV